MAMDFCEIEIIDGPLRQPALAAGDRAGAVVDFSGVVRGTESGCPIEGLNYEVHPRMARAELRRLAEEAATRFDLTGLRLLHRRGTVRPGEVSLYLRVAAERRAAALAAVQWTVDELKRRIPIWKHPLWADTGTRPEQSSQTSAPNHQLRFSG